MKNIVLFSILAISCLAFITVKKDYTTKNKVETKTSIYMGIKSADDLMTLYNKKEFPLSKLSNVAIEEFKNSLIFDENLQLRGAYCAQVKKELSEDEFISFLEVVTQSNAKMIDGVSVQKSKKSFFSDFVYCNNSTPTNCSFLPCTDPQLCSKCCGNFLSQSVCIAYCFFPG